MTNETENDTYWLNRVQSEIRGVEFFYPKDMRNPAPGHFAVVGPTSEVAQSGISIAHAAMLFLASFRNDDEARAAAADRATKNAT